MKNFVIKIILNFSFFLPGSSQFINKNWHKGVSLALSAITGLLMFIFGGEKVASLGLLVIMITWFTNFADIINQGLKPIFQDLHNISVSLERIADNLEIIVVQLKRIDVALFETEKFEMAEKHTVLLGGERKLLPPRREFLLLPPKKENKKVIFLPLPPKKKKEKLEIKSRLK